MNVSKPEQRIQTVSLLVLALIATAGALYWLSSILIPFIIAIFIALILTPFIDLLTRRLRVPRPLAVVITLAIIFTFIAIFGSMITVSVKNLAANSQTYQAQIESVYHKISSLPLFEQIEDMLSKSKNEPPLSETTEIPEVKRESFLAQIPPSFITQKLVSTTNAILDIFSKSLLVLIFIFFLLIGGKMRNKPIGGLRGDIEQRIRRFIIMKTILSAITGFLVGIILAICGVQFALVFGFLAFLLNYIPSIGSIIATLIPVPVILMSGLSPTTMVLAIALPAIIQFAVGNVIEPKMMGDSLDLHPVTLLVALIFWGNIWGIIGMLLAAPITAIIKILFEQLEVTTPIANLLAGRLDSFRSTKKEP